MSEFHVCGLGNALVDIFLDLDDAQFAALEFERGTMRLVDHVEQQSLLDRFSAREPRLVSGGSVANSIIAASQLGARGAKAGDLVHPLRVATTGVEVGPGLFDCLAILGRDEVLRRIQLALRLI